MALAWIALGGADCDAAMVEHEGCRTLADEEDCVALELAPVDPRGARTMVMADFDGDGRRDLLTGAGRLVPDLGAPRLVPGLELDRQQAYAVAVEPDGRAALLTADAGVVQLRRGPSLDGPEHVVEAPPGAEIRAVALADLDEDGRLDWILSTGDLVEVLWSGSRSPGSVTTIAAREPIDPVFAVRLDTGDFDGDGHVDLMITGTFHAWMTTSAGTRELGPLESAGQADPTRPWVVTDPDHDGIDEIYGVFPVPGAALPGIRALAWFWRDRALYHDHSFIPLTASERALAAGSLWQVPRDQLAVAIDGDEGPQLAIDCLDDGRLVPCGHASLPWSPDAMVIDGGRIVLAHREHGIWSLTWPEGAR